MKKILLLILATTLILNLNAQQPDKKLKGKWVLIFTKNGKGYVHENIPASIAAIQKLGA